MSGFAPMVLRLRASLALVTTLAGVLAAPVLAAPDPAAAGARRAFDAARQSSLAYEVVAHLADRVGPRPGGSPAHATAVRYVSDLLTSWGFTVRQERVAVLHWQRGEESGEVVAPVRQRLSLVALGGSVPTPPAGIEAEIVEVGSFEELTGLGDRVRGRIVLFNRPFDPALVAEGRADDAYGATSGIRVFGASRAAAQGAVGVLVRSLATASLRSPHTGIMVYEADRPRVPAAAVATEDADLLHRLLAAGEPVKVRLRLASTSDAAAPSVNLVADLPGAAAPGEIVLLAAHLDSWDLGTGAVDNASGVGMVLGAARAVRSLGPSRRTIRLLLSTGEETGYEGARAYWASIAKPDDPRGGHVAAIECDLGVGRPLGFVSNVPTSNLAPLADALEALRSLGGEITYAKDRGGEIETLAERGVPVFALRPDPSRYFDVHHTAADTLDKVDAVELQENTAVVAALAATLANAPLPVMPPAPAAEGKE
jgi:hypothetical protein